MFKFLVIAILLINSIFWGIYPPADDSPHSLIINYLGLNYKPGKFTHLLIGTSFYVVAVLIAQQQSIQHFWF